MVLMFVWDVYGDRSGQKCNSVVGGKWLELNVLRAFVYVFLILVEIGIAAFELQKTTTLKQQTNYV